MASRAAKNFIHGVKKGAKKLVNKALEPLRRHRKAVGERDRYWANQANRIKRGEIKNIYDR